MCCAKWLNRGTALGLLLGLGLGVAAAIAWRSLGEQVKERGEEQTVQNTEREKKEQAEADCKRLANAVAAYAANAANLGTTEDELLPLTLRELTKPKFGGQSFLKHGLDDLKDPWGNEYMLAKAQRHDGAAGFWVLTVAPDGIAISQFGIGERVSE
jgi:hypothetical protein